MTETIYNPQSLKHLPGGPLRKSQNGESIIVWRFFRKLKIELPYDPAIPLVAVYVQKNSRQDLKEIFAYSCSLQYYLQ